MAFVFPLITFVGNMDGLEFSFIIPVFNRPDEINELLESFIKLDGSFNFEIVFVEDGSTLDSKAIVEKYDKQNTGRTVDRHSE